MKWQAHLSKTLNYNPDNITVYQPVQGVHYIPPPPVSSLNSMASTSYGTSYHQFPTHPNLGAQPGRASRPQCTPAHSYRGFHPGFGSMNEFQDDQNGGMDVEMDTGRMSKQSAEQRPVFSSPPSHYGEDDFGAFSADAFAPAYQQEERRNPFQPADGSTNTDVWSPFRKGTGASGITNNQDRRQIESNGAVDMAEDSRWEGDDGMKSEDGEATPSSPGLDVNGAGTWATGRLRNTAAREQRSKDGSKSKHRP